MKVLITITIIIVAFTFFKFNNDKLRNQVAIIDTGININQVDKKYLCRGGHSSLTDSKWYEDDIGHGTNIYNIITQGMNPNTSCIRIFKIGDKNTDGNSISFNLNVVLNYLIDSKVKLINISMAGYGFSLIEHINLVRLVYSGKKVVVAAGNNNQNLDKKCDIYPACHAIYHDNFIVVGSNCGRFSNYGKVVDFYENGCNQGVPMMTGTSQATAKKTNKIVLTF